MLRYGKVFESEWGVNPEHKTLRPWHPPQAKLWGPPKSSPPHVQAGCRARPSTASDRGVKHAERADCRPQHKDPEDPLTHTATTRWLPLRLRSSALGGPARVRSGFRINCWWCCRCSLSCVQLPLSCCLECTQSVCPSSVCRHAVSFCLTFPRAFVRPGHQWWALDHTFRALDHRFRRTGLDTSTEGRADHRTSSAQIRHSADGR